MNNMQWILAALLPASLLSTAAREASAEGLKRIALDGASNIWDFSVGGGVTGGAICAIPYNNTAPSTTSGMVNCYIGNLTWNHGFDFTTHFPEAFPNGHAERIAVGNLVDDSYETTDHGVYVATVEGGLWGFHMGRGVWEFVANLPPELPSGTGTNGVLKLVYEPDNGIGRPANPVWLLGSNNRVYNLRGTTFVDAGRANVIQLSYSALWEEVTAMTTDGAIWVWNEGDPPDKWIMLTSPRQPTPQAIGGAFQARCQRSVLGECDGERFYLFFPVINGTGGWLNLGDEQTTPHHPCLGGLHQDDAMGIYTSVISQIGLLNSLDHGINEIYHHSAGYDSNTGYVSPVVSMAEGKALAGNPDLYGGGPVADHPQTETDLLWILNTSLQLYQFTQRKPFTLGDACDSYTGGNPGWVADP